MKEKERGGEREGERKRAREREREGNGSEPWQIASFRVSGSMAHLAGHGRSKWKEAESIFD